MSESSSSLLCVTNLDIVGMRGAVPPNTRYNVGLISTRGMHAI